MLRLIVRLLFVDTVHIAWILGGFEGSDWTMDWGLREGWGSFMVFNMQTSFFTLNLAFLRLVSWPSWTDVGLWLCFSHFRLHLYYDQTFVAFSDFGILRINRPFGRFGFVWILTLVNFKPFGNHVFWCLLSLMRHQTASLTNQVAFSIRANDLVPVLGNGNVVLIRLSFEEHGCWASLHAVFLEIYIIYIIFCAVYFYCKSFPFSFFFLFFDGTMLFFEEMKDKFTKQRSLSAVTPVVVCLDACVSVSCLDWSMDVHVASLHAFNCHLWNCLVSASNGEERLWHHSSNGGLLGKLLRLTNNTHPEWFFFFHFSNIGSVWFLLNCIRFQSSIWHV